MYDCTHDNPTHIEKYINMPTLAFSHLILVILLFKCLSSYLRNCPFFGIAGTGKPGCKYYNVFFNHSNYEYLLYTIELYCGVSII